MYTKCGISSRVIHRKFRANAEIRKNLGVCICNDPCESSINLKGAHLSPIDVILDMPKKDLMTIRVTIMSVGGRGANVMERIAAGSLPGVRLVAVGARGKTFDRLRLEEKIELTGPSSSPSSSALPRSRSREGPSKRLPTTT